MATKAWVGVAVWSGLEVGVKTVVGVVEAVGCAGVGVLVWALMGTAVCKISGSNCTISGMGNLVGKGVGKSWAIESGIKLRRDSPSVLGSGVTARLAESLVASMMICGFN